MSSYITAGANKLRKAREWATPTLKESAFLKRGVLTPEEFVKAGDELVYKCPTWSWESGDPKKIKNYLPVDKQVGLLTFYIQTCICFVDVNYINSE
jgi:hypothetical protein